MIRCKNDKCGFDLSGSGLTVDLGAIVRRTRPEEDKNLEARRAPTIYCPVCRAPNRIVLQDFDIFCRHNADGSVSYFRWLTSDKDRPRPQDVEKIPTPAGASLTLLLPGLRAISPSDISYPTVPAFAQVAGKLPALPALPIRKEFFDFVDLATISRNGLREPEYQGNTYSLTAVPLLGYRASAPARFSVPVLPARLDQEPGRSAEIYQGVQLAIWPNTPYREWKRFFIRLTASSGAKADFFRSNRISRLYYWENEDWQAADVKAADGVSLLAMTEARPEWLALEFVSGPSVVGGGIFRFPPADKNYDDGSTQLGVDFGTSNTCIAYQKAPRPEEVPLGDLDARLLDGSAEELLTDCINTWPLHSGFGSKKSFIFSEILTNRPVGEMTGPGRIDTWRPVLDYGIPQPTVTGAYSESGHIITEFKWPSSDEGSGSDLERIGRFQAYYLEFALLQSLAQLAGRNLLRAQATVRYSFPLAFDKEQKTTLAEGMQSVRKWLSAATGVAVTVQEGLDEAMSAGLVGGVTRSGEFLFVDIGGGSTDVAFLYRDPDYRIHPLFLTSFHYAGRALVRALTNPRTGCLAAVCSLEMFQRRLRDSRLARDVLRSSEVMQTGRSRIIDARTGAFYRYLREYLSRLIAARVILRSALFEKFPIDDEYELNLCPLGNGWGFGSHFNDYYEGRFGEELVARTKAILDEFDKKGEFKPRDYRRVTNLRINVLTLEGIHRKSAVAFGLLAEEADQHLVADQRVRPEDVFVWRKILGHDVTLGAKRYAWFFPLDSRNRKLPPLNEDLPAGRRDFDCPSDSMPTLPDDMENPYELGDRDLNQTRGTLVRRLPPRDGGWFADSAFEVLLEKLYGPSLETKA